MLFVMFIICIPFCFKALFLFFLYIEIVNEIFLYDCNLIFMCNFERNFPEFSFK